MNATAPGTGGTLTAWAELLRISALFTVPGDALAGAAAAGAAPNRRTLLAVGSSLCLYEAGMVLNDWADREEDARERPHRPLPSGRVSPAAALLAATGLTAAGLALAARAGRPALAVAGALAGTVWAYDLGLKHTPAGPVAMAAARSLDLFLGATATAPQAHRAQAAIPSAVLLGAHTLAVTTVSRRETQGGSSAAPLAALAATAVLGHHVARGTRAEPASTTAPPSPRPPAGRRVAAALGLPGSTPGSPAVASGDATRATARAALCAVYVATAARPLFHAALNPSPPLTQRAVGGGIRAMIPLQAALAARAGAVGTALVTMSLAPLARRIARKVSPT